MEVLQNILNSAGISCSDEQIRKMDRFYDLLIEKNKVMNLTAITDYRDACEKHFADSLMVTKYFSLGISDRVLDLGTGGGFPGIPLKIFYPETSFVLVDSVNKKLEFIREAKDELELENIEVIHGRAEDLAHDGRFREGFDLVVSRAVASLPVLSELALGFVRPDGCFISYKGSSVLEEVKASGRAMDVMKGKIERVEEYELAGSGEKRALVFVRKTGVLDDDYPRRAGVPGKKPL